MGIEVICIMENKEWVQRVRAWQRGNLSNPRIDRPTAWEDRDHGLAHPTLTSMV